MTRPAAPASATAMPWALALAMLPATPLARADEGMWTFDHPPLALLRERHGVSLSADWLKHLQGASVYIGASGSFVSSHGLMLTNHHVVEECVAQLSSATRNYADTGFLAATPADEKPCPGATTRVLLGMEDVSTRIQAAMAPGRDDAERNALRKGEIARLESACGAAAASQRCVVVPLYNGAVHQLYTYHEWTDVRLVWAPEAQAGFYGGDPDNFVYPRHALDAALVRVYENGQPVAPAQVLRLARKPLAEGDLVFVSGHPGRTDRLKTLAQLQAQRDADFPMMLAEARAEQAALHAYEKRSPEAARQAQSRLFGTENWLKAMEGEFAALNDPALMAEKARAEQAFRAAYRERQLPGDPWARVAEATATHVRQLPALRSLNPGYNTLFAQAGLLVELTHERSLPEAQRLPRFRDAQLPQLERELLAEHPFYAELEIVVLAEQLTFARERLGADHPYVRAAFGDSSSPLAAAERLIRPSQVGDAARRKAWLAGGAAAVDAADDPLLGLARVLYPLRRAVRLAEEEQVEAPLRDAADALGQARFSLYGHSVPPDATNTLRLSFGRVAGYVSNGISHPWKSTWGGWYARADAFDQRPPFNLPPRLLAARPQVDPRTPLDFVLTADIVGGNSGSPVVNVDGELVGLIFDGNLEGLGGAFAYQDRTGRAIAVHAEAIVTALDKVYGAPALARELREGR